MEGFKALSIGFLAFFFTASAFFLIGSVSGSTFFSQDISAGEDKTFLFRVDFKKGNFKFLTFIFLDIIHMSKIKVRSRDESC